MERQMMDELVRWKARENRKPLLLKGARQTGKTWLLKEFGRRMYDSFIHVNLDRNPDIAEIFAVNKNPEDIIRKLEYATRKKIEPGSDKTPTRGTKGSQWATNLVVKQDGEVISNELDHNTYYSGHIEYYTDETTAAETTTAVPESSTEASTAESVTEATDPAMGDTPPALSDEPQTGPDGEVGDRVGPHRSRRAAEGHDAVRVVVVRLRGQGEDAGALGVGQSAGRRRLLGAIFGEGLLGADGFPVDADDVRDEVRHVLAAGDDEYQRHAARQRGKEIGQHGAGGLVEPYERIVDNQYPRAREQRLGQLELAQFAARQLHDGLVQQAVDAQPFEEGIALAGVARSGGLERLARRGPHGVVALVPALLVVGRPLAVAVGVAEGDALDVVRRAPAAAGAEVVQGLGAQQGLGPREQFDVHGLSGPVGTDDGHLLARLDGNVDGFGHTVKRQTGYAVLYFDNFLHSSGVIRARDGRLTRSWFCLTKSAQLRAPPAAVPRRAARPCSRKWQ